MNSYEKIKYLKTVNGVCHTSCPHHDSVMIGSAKYEECIYCKEIHSVSELNHYVECRFDEFADEKKVVQTNSLGNRLKVKLKKEDGEDIGYVDGYVYNGKATYAIVYVPERNAIFSIHIGEIEVINEKE